ncbi:MAG TPA: CapA family protein [Spirochaetota bacterium]|nr:CapA family protein [Spirochaetota bacterium]HPO44206.1 CapA family protein [Spirochaetota bacterium]
MKKPALVLSLLLIAPAVTLRGEQPPGGISLLFCGDVMLDWGIREIVEREGYGFPLRRIRGFLSGFDYRFFNLECTISDEGEPHVDKKYVFNVPSSMIRVLSDGGFDGAMLANNHMSDYGNIALLGTISNLNSAGIHTAGAGIDAETASLPVLVKRGGISVAVFSFTNLGYHDAYAAPNSPGIARGSLDSIRRSIERFRGFTDFTVVNIHWGDEYTNYPSDGQIELGRTLIDAGADAVIGHHSHVYQGVEVYRGKPIVYSIGNFLFGSINEDIRDNIVVALDFVDRGLVSLRVFAISGNTASHPFQPARLTGKEAGSVLSHVLEISRPLKSDFSGKAVMTDSALVYRFDSPGEKP